MTCCVSSNSAPKAGKSQKDQAKGHGQSASVNVK